MIVKPGYRSTEFLAAFLASLSSWVAQWAGTLDPRWAAIVTGIAASAYAISRGLTKAGAYFGAAKATPGVVAPVVTADTATPPAAGVEKV